MTIASTDLQLRYSGGIFNTDPLQSVGGLMSGTAMVSNTIDNLFNSDPTLQPGQDFIDCRAIYVLNTNQTDSSFVFVYCTHDSTIGTNIELWIPRRNEQQQITFPNFSQIQGGSFSLKNGTTTTDLILWSSIVNNLADNIQSVLTLLANVIVTGSLANDTATFIVEFANNDGNKLQPILTTAENNISTLSGQAEIDISPLLLPITNQSGLVIMVPQRGTPINDVAENMIFSNNLPVEADGNWFPRNTWSLAESDLSIHALAHY